MLIGLFYRRGSGPGGLHQPRLSRISERAPPYFDFPPAMSAPNIPYIGSRISLISKAEIRYEGILYDVNKNDATVTLSKGYTTRYSPNQCSSYLYHLVRSYGTENRPAQKQVQPRNEVYEYIIFRGSDIKDLSVSEMSKAEEISHDPAILLTVRRVISN